MTPQQSAIAMARLASLADRACRFIYDTQGGSMSITLFLSALLIGLGVLVGNEMRISVEVARVRQTTQARRRRRSR